MTCIAGLVHRGRVYIGADSAVTTGDSLEILARPKVRRAGGVLLGAAGYMAFVSAVLYGIRIPRYRGEDPAEWCTTKLWPTIRDSVEPRFRRDSYVLVGVGGMLVTLSNGACVPQGLQYTAVGSGAELASGWLAASKSPPRVRVRKAIEHAAQHCATVRGPVTVLSTGPRSQ